MALLLAPAAQAQNAASSARSVGVLERPRPEYDPAGLHAGAFTILPSLGTQLTYGSNVLSTARARQGDVFLSIQPRLVARSTWSRHSLALVADGDIRRFADLRSENSEQVRGRVAARIDATRDIRVDATASAARLIEQRGTAGDAFATGKPVGYRELTGSLQVAGELGRASLRVRGDLIDDRYKDARISGVAVPLDYRDYRRRSATTRAAYAVGPGLAVYVEGSLSRSRYPDDIAGIDRSSHGEVALGGVAFDVTDVISGELGVGYLRETFADPAYANVGDLAYQLSLSWNPTPLLSVRAEGSRDVQRAPFVGAGAIAESRLRADIDYELLRQLIVTVTLEHVRDVYGDLGRIDRRYTGEIGARYLLRRSVSLSAGATYRQQDSSGALQRQYSEVAVRFRVTVQR